MTPTGQPPAGRAAQIDALHTVADWAAAHPGLPIGEISIRLGGVVWVHLSAAGPDEAPAALRAFAATQEAADLRLFEVRDLYASRRGRRLELRVPVPGIELFLWCYETVRAAPPATRPVAACARPSQRMAVR